VCRYATFAAIAITVASLGCGHGAAGTAMGDPYVRSIGDLNRSAATPLHPPAAARRDPTVLLPWRRCGGGVPH